MSLLETLIAFTLFVTVMAMLMGVWVAHARALELGQDQEVASSLCQMQMEQAMQLGFGAQSQNSVPFQMRRFIRGQPYDATFFYTVNVTNTTLPGITSPLHRVIVVNVTWHDASGNHTVSMESNAAW